MSVLDPVTSGKTEFVVSSGSKREVYHRADPESDAPQPACNTTRKVNGEWRQATQNQLVFVNPCTRDGCFGGEDGER